MQLERLKKGDYVEINQASRSFMRLMKITSMKGPVLGLGSNFVPFGVEEADPCETQL